MSRPVKSYTAGIIVFLAFNAGNLSAQAPAGQVDAYVQIIKAEQAEKDGDLKEAVELYRSAIHLYEEVKNTNPDWRPDLVRYRIADSLNQILRIERELGAKQKQPEKKSEPPAPAVSEGMLDELKTLRENAASLRNQNQELTDQMEHLRQQVEMLRHEAADSKADRKTISSLNQEIEKLTAENDGMAQAGIRTEEQLIILQSENQTLSGLIAKMESENKKAVQDAVSLLDDEITALEKEQQAMKASYEKQLAEMAAEKDKAAQADKKRIDDLDAERAGLKKEIDSRYGPAREVLFEEAREKLEADNARLFESLSETTEMYEKAKEQLAVLSSGRDPELNSLREDRERLTREVKALKETIDLNHREMDRVREYKKEIKNLGKSNKQLNDELDKLQKEMAGNDLTEDFARVTSQNNILAEEVQTFRKMLEASEKQVRQLERDLSNQTSR